MSKLVLSFDMYEIDDWEAGNEGAMYADIIYLTINGMDVPLGSYKNEWDEGFMQDWFSDIKWTSQSYAPPSQLGFSADFLDQKHKLSVEIPNRYILSDGTINIGFRASFTADNEAVGFDNIKLFASCEDKQLAPTAAPTRSSDKRNFTFTNNFSPGVTGDPHIKGWNGTPLMTQM
jgi:hypothetical protein